MARQTLETLGRDLRHALRGVRRDPAFTLMVVVTLALGVGANAAVFSVLDRVFGQTPAGVADPGGLRRLYIEFPERVTESGVGMIFAPFNYPAFAAVRDAAGESADVAAWTPSAETVIRSGDAELTVRRSAVSHDFFALLGVGAALGRIFGADEARVELEAPVAVISHAFWQRAFALDPGVIGRTLEMGGVSVTIIGVSAEGFAGLDLNRTDLFYPLSLFTGSSPEPGLPWYQGTGNFLRAVARLAPGGDEGALTARATAAYRHGQTLPGGRAADSTAVLHAASIVEARGPGPRDASVEVSLRVAGVTLMVLLIACANVASLLLVRATRRRREVGVRLALGVSGRRLFSQLLTESLVLATLAGGVALLVAVRGGEALRRLMLPSVQWAQPAVELRTVAFTLGTALAVGLLAGLAPALLARRVDVNTTLRAGGREAGVQRSTLRSALLVLQAALSVVLLAGSVLFLRSLENVASLRLGYDLPELAWVRTSIFGGPDREAMDALAGRLAGAPGVAEVTLATAAPMMGGSSTRLHLPGRDSLPPFDPMSYPQFVNVPPEYFRVTGTRIVEGRVFDPKRGTSRSSAQRWRPRSGPARARSVSASIWATRTRRASASSVSRRRCVAFD
jgi:predicted permease